LTTMTLGNGGTDKLVAESERLRERLLRMAAKLEVFADELTGEAQNLRDEADAPNHPEGSENDRGNDSARSGPNGPVDQDGHRTDGRG
jgi:hypothetical protein